MDQHWSDAPEWRDHPNLSGIMKPVAREIDVEECRVTGTIPVELDGLLVRNGPNNLHAPRGRDYHFFDGDGMAHGLWISGGRARYRNRWVQTDCYRRQVEAGRSLWAGMLEHPLRHPPPRGGPASKEHGGINTVWHAGRLLALDEIGPPWELDPDTLETRGRFDWGGRWDYPFTPHPKIDAETGEMVVFGYRASRAPYYQHAVVDADGQLGPIVPIDLPRGVMSHDIAITRKYSVLLDVPVAFTMGRALLGGSLFTFQPRHGARLGLLPRHARAGDAVQWFDIKPCAIMHVVAAWEEDDEVVLVAPRIEQFDMRLSAVNPTAPGGQPESWEGLLGEVPLLHRWRLDTRSGRVVEERQLYGSPVEFPRVNDRFMGQRVRYGYCMASEMDHHLKFDLQDGTHTVHRHGPERFCFEMVFRAPPGGPKRGRRLADRLRVGPPQRHQRCGHPRRPGPGGRARCAHPHPAAGAHGAARRLGDAGGAGEGAEVWGVGGRFPALRGVERLGRWGLIRGDHQQSDQLRSALGLTLRGSRSHRPSWRDLSNPEPCLLLRRRTHSPMRPWFLRWAAQPPTSGAPAACAAGRSAAGDGVAGSGVRVRVPPCSPH